MPVVLHSHFHIIPANAGPEDSLGESSFVASWMSAFGGLDDNSYIWFSNCNAIEKSACYSSPERVI
jgi:diadenosine tetraphosphate (Ap4A) HIT family hydrolase